MSTLTNIQEAIEKRAQKRLSQDIEKMVKEVNQILCLAPITRSVSIRVADKDLKISRPYLRQLFENAEVINAIFEQNINEYVTEEINQLLNPKK